MTYSTSTLATIAGRLGFGRHRPPAPEPTRQELAERRAALLADIAAGRDLARERSRLSAEMAQAIAEARRPFIARIAELDRQIEAQRAAKGKAERIAGRLRQTADPVLTECSAWLDRVAAHLRAHDSSAAWQDDQEIDALQRLGVQPGQVLADGKPLEESQALSALLAARKVRETARAALKAVQAAHERVRAAEIAADVDAEALAAEVVQAIGFDCPACGGGYPLPALRTNTIA